MKTSDRNYVCLTALLLACLTCLLWQRRTIAHLRDEIHQKDAIASEPPAEATDIHRQANVDESQLNQISGLQFEIERLRQLVSACDSIGETNRLLREELDKLKLGIIQSSPVTSALPAVISSTESVPEASLTEALPEPESDPPSEKVEAHKKLVICASQLQQIGIAAVLWSEANGGLRPTNFLMLTNYLAPMMLICPGDTSKPRQFTLRFSTLDPTKITYRLARHRSRMMNTDPFASCPIHNSHVKPFMWVFAPGFYYNHAWGGYVPH
jgi:hypothetical protein